MSKKNKKMKPWRALSAATLAAGVTLPALPVVAQDAASLEGIETSPPLGQYRLSVGGGYRTEADLDKGDGKVGEGAFRVVGAGLFNINDRFKLAPIVSYQFSDYTFSDLFAPGGRKMDDTAVHIGRATALLQYKFDDQWTIYGGPSGSFAFQDGADFGDSLSGGGLAGFNYRFNDRLDVGAGFGIFSKLNDSPFLLPFITANWQFADPWSLRVGFQEVAGNGGFGGEVTYDFKNNWMVGAGVQVEQKRFRLKDNGPEPGGVAQDRNVPIYAKVTWQAHEKVAVELIGGVVVGGNIRLEDNGGHRWGDIDYDPSAVIGLRAILRF